jgi:signal transduction histidine kinase
MLLIPMYALATTPPHKPPALSDVSSTPAGVGAGDRPLTVGHAGEHVLQGVRVNDVQSANDGGPERRIPDPWAAGRATMAVIALIVILQGGIITWLLIEHRGRVRAERQSRAYLVDMAQMDRTVTIGTLSSSIAHEINQPLAAILANAQAAEVMLNRKSPSLDRIGEILHDIRQDDQRVIEIVKRMRALLHRSELRTQDVDLGDVVSNVLGIVAPETRVADVQLDDRRMGPQVIVRADPVHVQQVVLNLVMNALDAMRGRGGRRVLSILLAKAGAGAQLSIVDTGCGIAPDKLEVIFNPRYSTKSEGMGMGLFIARMIVSTYSGRIWAESWPEDGTAFHVVLPLASDMVHVASPLLQPAETRGVA